ncbi:helix-turn-helix domain-containing protein [Dysgonomonas termitidis]|uniref:Helix-turn-helix domain-containing protein n=1 Tax=Dysgonomonas termitidis TaxID=1516126 RepID=A0ABV9KZM0_9BACT
MKRIAENDARVFYFFNSIDRILNQLRTLSKDCKLGLNGDRYMTDEELSKYLRVNRRTLTDYRKNGVLPYINFGGKTLYKESEIQEILDKSYSPKRK